MEYKNDKTGYANVLGKLKARVKEDATLAYMSGKATATLVGSIAVDPFGFVKSTSGIGARNTIHDEFANAVVPSVTKDEPKFVELVKKREGEGVVSYVEASLARSVGLVAGAAVPIAVVATVPYTCAFMAILTAANDLSRGNKPSEMRKPIPSIGDALREDAPIELKRKYGKREQ